MPPEGQFTVMFLLFAFVLGGTNATSAQERERVDAYLAARRYGEAQQLARAVLERGLDGGTRRLSPDEAHEWRSTLASAYAAEGDFEAAVTEYQSLLGKGPVEFTVAVALELAQCRLEMWDPTGARAVLGEAWRWPRAAIATRLELLAVADFMSERYDEARAKFSQVAKANPVSLHYLGLLAYRRGEHESALGYFRKSLALNPEDYVGALHEVLCLVQLDRLDGARAVLERIERFAGTAEVAELFGRIDMRSGRYSEAEKRFRDALALSPTHLEAAFGLGRALKRQRRAEEARKVFRRFQDLHRKSQVSLRRAYVLDQNSRSSSKTGGDNAAAAIRLGQHYLESGDPESAERSSWHAIRALPNQIEPRLTLARALARMGRHAQAAVHYRRILRQKADFQPALVELEQLIRRHGRSSSEPSTGGKTSQSTDGTDQR